MGREILCWNVNGNFAGDTVDKFCWKMNSAGDRKTSPRTIFPWQLAEDNPVIPWWGNNLPNKAGGRSYYAGGKLPESTGDKLPAGDMDSTFLGKFLDWTLLGKFFQIGLGKLLH